MTRPNLSLSSPGLRLHAPPPRSAALIQTTPHLPRDKTSSTARPPYFSSSTAPTERPLRPLDRQLSREIPPQPDVRFLHQTRARLPGRKPIVSSQPYTSGQGGRRRTSCLCESETNWKKVCKATISDNPMACSPRLSPSKEPALSLGYQPACRVQEGSDVVYLIFHPYITLVSPALDCFSTQPRFMLRLGRRSHLQSSPHNP